MIRNLLLNQKEEVKIPFANLKQPSVQLKENGDESFCTDTNIPVSMERETIKLDIDKGNILEITAMVQNGEGSTAPRSLNDKDIDSGIMCLQKEIPQQLETTEHTDRKLVSSNKRPRSESETSDTSSASNSSSSIPSSESRRTSSSYSSSSSSTND